MTQAGIEKAAHIAGAGPIGRVFSCLQEEGPSSCSEIASNTGMDINLVKRVVQLMLSKGFVTV